MPGPMPDRPTEPAQRRVDPLLPTGVVLTSAGVTLGLIGGAVLGSGSDQGNQSCGLNGCVQVQYDTEDDLRGRALLAAGIGMAAVGIPSMVLGWGGAPPMGERASEGSMVAGVWLAGIGASTAAFGIVHGLGSSGRSIEGDSAPLAFAIGGGAVGALGATMAYLGSRRGPGRGGEGHKYKSPGRIYTGMSLATIGAVGTVGAIHSIASFRGNPYGVTLVSMPILLASAGLLGAGIPLWATGSRTIPLQATPEVSVGPGGGTMRWRF